MLVFRWCWLVVGIFVLMHFFDCVLIYVFNKREWCNVVIVVEAPKPPVETISAEDLEEIEQILESLVEERTRLKKEQESLQTLKDDVVQYMEVRRWRHLLRFRVQLLPA